jgi:hypothetical protein
LKQTEKTTAVSTRPSSTVAPTPIKRYSITASFLAIFAGLGAVVSQLSSKVKSFVSWIDDLSQVGSSNERLSETLKTRPVYATEYAHALTSQANNLGEAAKKIIGSPDSFNFDAKDRLTVAHTLMVMGERYEEMAAKMPWDTKIQNAKIELDAAATIVAKTEISCQDRLAVANHLNQVSSILRNEANVRNVDAVLISNSFTPSQLQAFGLTQQVQGEDYSTIGHNAAE